MLRSQRPDPVSSVEVTGKKTQPHKQKHETNGKLQIRKHKLAKLQKGTLQIGNQEPPGCGSK